MDEIERYDPKTIGELRTSQYAALYEDGMLPDQHGIPARFRKPTSRYLSQLARTAGNATMRELAEIVANRLVEVPRPEGRFHEPILVHALIAYAHDATLTDEAATAIDRVLERPLTLTARTTLRRS